MSSTAGKSDDPQHGVAIIGMAGQFPGAKDVDEFWRNIRDGVESISFFSDEELIDAGVDPDYLKDPTYVKAKGALKGAETFDAAFFGMNPRDAEIMDPQQRLLLESAWQALEHAGYDHNTYNGSIGVFAGSGGEDTYFLNNLYANYDLRRAIGLPLYIANIADFVATRISYLLNLKGPSVSVQTACSTSLVAVCMACQSLLNYQCDMALAGAACVTFPLVTGYHYREGMILSPDGHCKAFDASGRGTIAGNGAGMVLLKRLEDAIADGDTIYAVIRGVAINNDGSSKIGYTAPSVDGQADVIAQALAVAEVDADTISYVEAHGTGTPLGDPIELSALTKAFRASAKGKQYCALGSVKTNIGHLDVAAGISGLIKTVQALKHKQIPPSLHYQSPNPEIDFANSPFFVQSELAEWKADGGRRRAGVSSFGMGGTNAHVILEEAPPPESSGESRPWQLLVLSAKTKTALESVTASFVEYLKQNPDVNFADLAYTLQVGRKAFKHRRMLISPDPDDAAIAITTLGPRRVFSDVYEGAERPVIFMFSGQGSQYLNMAQELYQTEPMFREHVDSCAEYLAPLLGLDLRLVLYPPDEGEEAKERLKQTAITQPVLFVIEYALAKLWIAWGVHPAAMIGHSLGEYVAACLAGVFSLEDALMLVALRGQMMQEMPGGAMLGVPLPEQEVRSLMGPELDLAAVNSASLCVVSGPTTAIEDLQDQLDEQGVEYQRLLTSHAFHSRMIEPIVRPFIEKMRGMVLQGPQIPLVSNVTGTWLTDAEAKNPEYWAKHLRQPVLFAQGIQELMNNPARILLEVGPGRTLSTLVKQQPNKNAKQLVLTTLRHPYERQSDVGFLLNTLGQLWLAGIHVNWSGLYAHEQRRRVPLPTYPFERQSYLIAPPDPTTTAGLQQDPLRRKHDVANWFYTPSWKRAVLPSAWKARPQATPKLQFLIFIDDYGMGARTAARLSQSGHEVTVVTVGRQFNNSGSEYKINPHSVDDYVALLRDLRILAKLPQVILHFWGISAETPTETLGSRHNWADTLGFYSLLFMAQAVGKQRLTDELRLGVVTNYMQSVTEATVLYPAKATVLGPCKVIPKEMPNIRCTSIDIDLPPAESLQENKLIDDLVSEIVDGPHETIVAYRSGTRWVQAFEPVPIPPVEGPTPRLKERGTYLITGGLTGIGFAIAEHMAKTARARLILPVRSDIPPKDQWKEWLSAHESEDLKLGSTAQQVHRAMELEALGAEVLLIKADVSSLEQMHAALSKTTPVFGKINGVIHAEGTPVPGGIQQKTREGAESILAPKVKGTLVLDALLSMSRLDFFVLCSSVTSILGAFRQVDYGAANAFLEAFAQSKPLESDMLMACITWDTLRENGAAVDAGKERAGGPSAERNGAAEPGPTNEAPNEGLSTEEAVEAFRRVLGSSLTHVIVSTQNLEVRIEQKRTAAIAAPVSLREVEVDSIPRSVHPRPKLTNEYVAPRNAIERMIAEIWQKFFGIETVGIYDDFFALGGDSLLAVQLISKLRKTINAELPSHSLLGSPTISALAELVQQVGSPSSLRISKRPVQTLLSTLVKIKPGNQGRPLFLIHPVGGHVYFYRDLAQYLRPDLPIYGLQAQGVDGREAPLTRIEEMADKYIEALRLVQLEGPYLIGGSSFGGVVAFEMAHQLKAMGQEVAMLVMMDTPGPGQMPERHIDGVERMAYLISGNAEVSAPSSQIQEASADEQLLHALKKRGIANRMFSDLALPQLSRFQELVKVNLQAMASYVPRPYPGNVAFFRASERDEFTVANPEKGWIERVTGKLSIHEVPGNHITMNFPPHVRIMAEWMNVYIDEARARISGAR